MRTCPACGEDTEAGSAEACTECGFSPADPEVFETEPDPRYEPVGFEPEPEPEATFEVGSTEAPPAPPTEPSQIEPAPAEPAPSEPAPTAPKRSLRRRSAFWIAIAAVIFLADFTGAFGIFDDPTGPTPEEVEGALVHYASEQGGTVTVDCPEDTEDTEVGDSFDCVATNARGQTRTVTVTNNEDDFSWNGKPLIQLIRRDLRG